MLRSLNSGVSAMRQFQERMDVIGNNVANVNTTGFKSARVDFAETFSQKLGAGTGGIPMQIGTGVGTSSITNQFIQGAISRTGTPTDMAVSGNGFFVLRDDVSGAQFVTRDGAFRLDEDGYVVNSSALRLQGFTDSALSTRGDLRINVDDVQATRVTAATAAVAAAQTAVANADPNDQAAVDAANQALEDANADLAVAQKLDVASFSIDGAGKVTVRMTDGTEVVRGQVLLQSFQNPQGLTKEGGNLYSFGASAGAMAQTEAPGTAGLGELVSGALEMSNVDLANEFSSLITTQRAFQASARIISTSDEILQELVNLKR